jgi:fatty-acyl-CoA synthase
MLSYACGPRLPLLEKSIGQVLDEAVERNPSGDAIVSRHQNLRLSYRDLQHEVAHTARGLWGLGIRPGDRIGMWASSCAEWVYLQVATARIGAVLVNVNPAYRSHELRFVLRKSGMKAIFLNEKDARVNYLEVLNEARQEQDLPLAHTVILGGDAWAQMIDCGVQPPERNVDIDEVVNIQYTSGTTGSPKGVLLTHRNLVNNAYLVGRNLKLGECDRMCVPVPLYHCFGCVMGSLECIVFAIPLVLPAPQFDALATLQAIEAERCTIVYGVPTMFIAQLEHPRFREFNLRSLRTGIMAGSPCPVAVMQRVVDEMNCREITIAYGQTESSPAITMSSTDDDLEARVSTVGQALPETEVKIVDTAGATVPLGERGELCTRGYLVMKGYDGEPEATARAIDAEGWLHTGDLATMREDGCFHISGRLKELIIRGGENVSPAEIEEVLRSHPAVADAACFGVPDEKYGEQVACAVALTGEADERALLEHCRERLTAVKVPKRLYVLSEIPRTPTGKLQRRRIAESLLQ